MSWRAEQYRARLARRADATNVPPGELAERELQVKLAAAKDSPLEKRFTWAWQAIRGPELVREHHFHPIRKWRFDFAHLPSKVAIEIEGGTWMAGRHNTGAGIALDCEKYNIAILYGWRVFRVTGEMIRVEPLTQILHFILRQPKVLP